MHHLHFLFAPHAGAYTPKILSILISNLEKQGIRPAFITIEGYNIQAKLRSNLEAWFKNPKVLEREGLDRQRSVEDALNEWIDRRMSVRKPRRAEIMSKAHTLGLILVAQKHGIPLLLAEAPRRRQYKKTQKLLNKVKNLKKPVLTNFESAVRQEKDEYFKIFNAMQARHDEVLKTLSKTLGRYEENAVGIVTLGTDHAGLDKLAESRLGVTTTDQTHPLWVNMHEAHLSSLLSEHYVNEARKPSEDDFARLVLARILSRKLSNIFPEPRLRREKELELADIVRGLNRTEIQRVWSRVRAAQAKNVKNILLDVLESESE